MFIFQFSGTDADATSNILNETTNTNKTKTLPTINMLYQMLHSNPEHNQTKLIENFNYSNFSPINSLNSYNTLLPNLHNQDQGQCCPDVNSKNLKGNNVTLIMEANLIDQATDNKRNRKRRVVKVVRTDEVTIGDINIEMTPVSTIPSISPIVMERKKKPGETGSSAPLLNYIFDTYSNTHHHRNEK